MIDDLEAVEIGVRLREERERLGLTQETLAKDVGVTKLTQLRYESAQSHPTAAYLAHFAKLGADVLYVVTGERRSSKMSLDPIQTAVLASLALCSPQRRVDAVQHMALLAAGMSPQTPAGGASPQPSVTKAAVSKSILGVAVGKVHKGK